MTATACQRAECQRLARAIWAEREKGFPRFVQQTWEQGTQLARDTTLIQAARSLGLLPALAAAARQGGDVEQAPGETPQSGAESATPNPSNPIPPIQCEERS